tara:strand:+ start:1850 stop:2032 length:183 start_codon:yes stop_codon:yes gene_type:complete
MKLMTYYTDFNNTKRKVVLEVNDQQEAYYIAGNFYGIVDYVVETSEAQPEDADLYEELIR